LIICNLCGSSTLPYHLSVTTLHSSDPDPHQIERHDPDPHQSDKLDLDPDPRQFSDDKAKIIEYELILALFPGFKPFFVSYLQIDKQVLDPHLSDADRQRCYTDNLFIFRTFLIYDFFAFPVS
jgi:hypothetical protein